MKTLCFLTALFFISDFSFAQQIPSKEIQIKTALMAAPDELKADAMVYGYDEKGNLMVLRRGNNDLICLTDDPNSPGFNVACYHKDLDEFMERGRVLKREGKSAQEIFDIREAEAKSGKLKMPKDGATLYVRTADAKDYNPLTGEVQDSYLRYVVYIPWATAESTGLPLRPSGPAMPWIMDPGTHRAHIMINPPRDN
ncbi:hypothetical protein [Cecembia lonarensis]|uniref:Uncharacterized protein n=1 Tax=Cecembia lonarensis (strain CCUG 58316 / KCTC 22772 / LW9) TaxID=1225176 RepID=K1L291_CECL9|nr:hypothetical protein [Cecembia lonarensis]EKB50535.1 hypothetical protein B879_00736 [Cecembia lonarensis LW9]